MFPTQPSNSSRIIFPVSSTRLPEAPRPWIRPDQSQMRIAPFRFSSHRLFPFRRMLGKHPCDLIGYLRSYRPGHGIGQEGLIAAGGIEPGFLFGFLALSTRDAL
jgi:hypothetical protein